jgi:simple sugar transport system ATP-binding protein
MDMSDRVLVMYEGEIVHETTPAEADRERIGLEMTGGSGEEQATAPVEDGGETA